MWRTLQRAASTLVSTLAHCTPRHQAYRRPHERRHECLLRTLKRAPHRSCIIAIAVLGFVALAGDAAALDVNRIVSRSVATAQSDWKAAPQFDFRERDIITKGGNRTLRAYQVLMIHGSTYNRLIAQNGQPLNTAQTAAEEQKLQHEIQARTAESPAARTKRIAQYQRERRQDHELMLEMIKAFQFHLAGTETMD